jgi:glycine/D-amino acid oxidase-like deaminating enzyme
VTALVKNELEGTVHTGKMMATLQQKVARAGVVVYANTEVLAVEKRNEGMRIEVEHAGKRINFVSTQVALTTNAFTKTFLPDLDLQPGRGLVLVTKPHPALRWEGSFHYHDGYHYFRTIDGRLLLGGGRQLDVQGEQTTEKGVNPLILQQLQADIEDFIAPGVGLEVDYCWSGTMAFGHDKNPVVQRIHEGLVAGVRLGGMGVAIGAGVGRELAAILEG